MTFMQPGAGLSGIGGETKREETNMKRDRAILAILLALCLVLPLGACASKKTAAARAYAARVASICRSLPRPTSGTIIGGWGTI